MRSVPLCVFCLGPVRRLACLRGGQPNLLPSVPVFGSCAPLRAGLCVRGGPAWGGGGVAGGGGGGLCTAPPGGVAGRAFTEDDARWGPVPERNKKIGKTRRKKFSE